MLAEPGPAGSKRGPPLAKDEPVSDGCGTSAAMYLRKSKKFCTAAVREEWEKCKRNSLADIQVSAEGGGEDAPGTGAEIPLQPMKKTMVKQVVPHKGPCRSRYPHYILWEKPQAGALEQCG